jgi:hypothetical protein
MSIPDRAAYESLVYGLVEQYEEIDSSTLRLYSTSALTAVVEGEIFFHNGLILRVLEVLDFKARQIQNYSYAVYRRDEKIRWYDPQPHPENPALAATFPHHYHDPPNIKHNRLPAPGISFEAANFATLIANCVELGKSFIEKE